VHTVVTIIHIIASVVLIMVVLLQAGKGANMGAAFGGASQTVFGSSGAGTFLGKMTTLVAAVFMLTSLSLSYFAMPQGSSVMNSASRPVAGKAAPRTPITPADAGNAGAKTLPSMPPPAK
jgi:preprotein translocase subunit SecG